MGASGPRKWTPPVHPAQIDPPEDAAGQRRDERIDELWAALIGTAELGRDERSIRDQRAYVRQARETLDDLERELDE